MLLCNNHVIRQRLKWVIHYDKACSCSFLLMWFKISQRVLMHSTYALYKLNIQDS